MPPRGQATAGQRQAAYVRVLARTTGARASVILLLSQTPTPTCSHGRTHPGGADRGELTDTRPRGALPSAAADDGEGFPQRRSFPLAVEDEGGAGDVACSERPRGAADGDVDAGADVALVHEGGKALGGRLARRGPRASSRTPGSASGSRAGRGLVGEDVDALVQVAVAGGLRDAGIAGRTVDAAVLPEPGQHQDGLPERGRRPRPARGPQAAAMPGRETGEELDDVARDVERGSIGEIISLRPR